MSNTEISVTRLGNLTIFDHGATIEEIAAQLQTLTDDYLYVTDNRIYSTRRKDQFTRGNWSVFETYSYPRPIWVLQRRRIGIRCWIYSPDLASYMTDIAPSKLCEMVKS